MFLKDPITQSKKLFERICFHVLVTLRSSRTQSDLRAAQNNLGLPQSGVTGVALPCSRALQPSARAQKELQSTATPAEPEVNTSKFIIFF